MSCSALSRAAEERVQDPVGGMGEGIWEPLKSVILENGLHRFLGLPDFNLDHGLAQGGIF